MKKWNGATCMLAASCLLAAPAVLVQPTYAASTSADNGEAKVIPLPAELAQVLKDLKDDYVPALKNLHTDSLTEEEGAGYRLVLSDEKSKITAGIALALAVDENGNITYLELTDPDRDKTKHFDKDAQYQKAVSFIHEQVALDHAVSAAGLLSTRRGTGTDNLLAVPVYPTQNGIPVKKVLGEAMIDADGQIVKFYQRKQKLPLASEVADPDKAVAQQRAQQSWEAALSMKLVYDQETGKLVYVPDDIPVIDSLTGQVVPDLYTVKSELVKSKGTATKDWWKDRASMEKLLTQGLKLSVGKLKFDYVTEKDKKSDVDVYEWTSVVNESAKVVLDRKTRTPILLEVEGQAEAEREQPLTAEEGKMLALQWAEMYLLSGEQSFELKSTSLTDALPKWVDQEQGRLTSVLRYELYPQIDGIASRTPLYTIKVDGKKGKVIQVRVSNAAGPSANVDKQNLIGEEKAKEAFLKQATLRQYYWYPKANNQTAELPQLVYMATEDSLSRAIDAHSGEAVNVWLEREE